MDSVALWLSDDDSDSDVDIQSTAKKRKFIRDNSDILALPSKRFIKLFRLSKEAFIYVRDEIVSELQVAQRSTAVSPTTKLAASLRFLAEGGYQQSFGQDFEIGLAQQTISKVLQEILDAIEKKLCPKWISLRMSETEKQAAKTQFYSTTGFPGVIGAIDGTFIQIIRPIKDEHLFLSRKLKHMINTMIICDHERRIRAVDGRFGGATHDSAVWSVSEERKFFMDGHAAGEKSWLLGDSGYPLEPWLMTPYRIAPEGSAESKFNDIHSKCRNIVERTFGTLKGRFRCLLAARELHYTPQKAVQILNVCCALHNICLHYGVEEPEYENDNESDDDINVDADTINLNATLLNEAKKIRDNIKNAL